MSYDGFVERPTTPRDTRMQRLRDTADNGKALKSDKPFGTYTTLLRREGLQVRQRRQQDGTYLVWCERITPSNVGRADSVDSGRAPQGEASQ